MGADQSFGKTTGADKDVNTPSLLPTMPQCTVFPHLSSTVFLVVSIVNIPGLSVRHICCSGLQISKKAGLNEMGRPRINDNAKWNDCKERLCTLYLDEARTFKEVKLIIADEFDFRPRYVFTVCACPLPVVFIKGPLATPDSTKNLKNGVSQKI